METTIFNMDEGKLNADEFTGPNVINVLSGENINIGSKLISFISDYLMLNGEEISLKVIDENSGLTTPTDFFKITKELSQIGTFFVMPDMEMGTMKSVVECNGFEINRMGDVSTSGTIEGTSLFNEHGELPEIEWGSVLITPDTADVPKKAEVYFEKTFSEIPKVIVTANTTDVKGVSVANITRTGCEVYLTRSDLTGTLVNWCAMY